MSKGFAVILRNKKAGNAARGIPMRIRWMYIHHSNEIANKRGLEEHVERDKKDKITSQRKQESTYISQMSYKWGAGISFKAIYKSKGDVRDEDKTWILIITCNDHTYAIAPNPLAYMVHRKRRPKYQKALELAITHREAFLTYGALNKIIEAAGVKLDRKAYYNIKINYMISK
jgi:hypothetical protein